LRKDKYKIIITRHAFIRAIQRKIDPDIIEQVLQTGKTKIFGKNKIRIEKKLKKFSVICIDEIIGDTIKIVTITKKMRK
tara:strand:- start:2962 stop:3198 length:237 start_codon:yes stop_codon:yes gene_type:complete